MPTMRSYDGELDPGPPKKRMGSNGMKQHILASGPLTAGALPAASGAPASQGRPDFISAPARLAAGEARP